jgi:hypothetical protein
MKGGQLVAILLSAVIFFLQGGDCMSMLVKSKQAHDCCKKGHCSRTNPDPCCQVSARTDIAKDQVKQKTALPDLVLTPMVVVWIQPISDVARTWVSRWTTIAPSPPGAGGNFSIPLLV